MKKFLTSIMAIVLAIACCLGLTACGQQTANVRPNQIVVGYTDYEPMNYKDGNVLMGFDTELALMVFNALGYEVKFTLIDWSQKYQELDSSAIDCVWNGFTMNSTDEIDGVVKDRADIVDFTKPYMENAQCIVRLSSTTALTNKEDLTLKSVAYEEGSAGQSYIEGVKAGENAESTADDINLQLVSKTSQMDAVREVKMGTADYAVVDINLARSVVGKGDFADLTINESVATLELPQEYYAVAFKKGSDLVEKVNIMFDAFAKTGQLQTLAEKYGVGEVVIKTGFID